MSSWNVKHVWMMELETNLISTGFDLTKFRRRKNKIEISPTKKIYQLQSLAYYTASAMFVVCNLPSNMSFYKP